MDWKNHHRVLIITGHFGSGKTELSINLGLLLRSLGEKVALIDLDIINTYFRLREQEEILEKNDIKVYSTGIQAKSLDIPALDPAIEAVIADENRRVIIDVGGNPSGARALARYRDLLRETGYENIFVINANRPETKNSDEVIDFINRTQDVSGTKITALFNTSHFLKDTTAEDVLQGLTLAEEISERTGLPLLGTVCLRSLVDEIAEKRKDLYLLPIDLHFRDQWMV